MTEILSSHSAGIQLS